MTTTASDLSPLGELLLRRVQGDRSDAILDAILALLRPAVMEAPDDLPVFLALLAPPRSLGTVRYLVDERDRDRTSTVELACLAAAIGLLTDADLQELVDALPERHTSALRRHRIGRLVAAGRLDEAHAEAELLKDPLRGHRDVGLHLAWSGDHEQFFAEWTRLEPRRKTAELAELREVLVGAVARQEGWQAALALVDAHPRLGQGYVMAALAATEVAPYDELEQLLAGPLGQRLEEGDRVRLLVDQLLREVPPAEGGSEDPRVLPLAERIGALSGDPELGRVRDSLLVRLWPLVAEETTLRRVRALVRTPNLRSELTALLRDVPAPR